MLLKAAAGGEILSGAGARGTGGKARPTHPPAPSDRGLPASLSGVGSNSRPPPRPSAPERRAPPPRAQAYRGVSRHPVAASPPRPVPLAPRLPPAGGGPPRRAAAPLRRAGRRLHALAGATRLRSGRRHTAERSPATCGAGPVPPPSRSAPPSPSQDSASTARGAALNPIYGQGGVDTPHHSGSLGRPFF